MNRTKKAVSGAAIVAAGVGAFALGLASPAGASCASVSGMTVGNGLQCASTPGNSALALGPDATAIAVGGLGNTSVAFGDEATAYALGGLGNSSFAWGDYASAVTGTGSPLNFLNTSLAAGTHTNAYTAGIANGAADLGENSAPTKDGKPAGSAYALGSFNRVVNIGGDNTGVAVNKPSLDPPNIGLNTVLNVGTKNFSYADGNAASAIATGNKNTAIVNGTVSLVAAVGEWSTAVVKGDRSGANATGTGNFSYTEGNESMAGAFGERSTATVFGDNGLAASFGKKAESVVIGDNSHSLAAGVKKFAGAFGDNKNAVNGVNNG